jgi:hypothetical protein
MGQKLIFQQQRARSLIGTDSAVKTACRHGSAQDHCPTSLDRNCATRAADEKWFPTPKTGRPTVTNARAGKRQAATIRTAKASMPIATQRPARIKNHGAALAMYIQPPIVSRSGMMFWWAIGEPICLESAPGQVRRMQQNRKLGAIKVQQGSKK